MMDDLTTPKRPWFGMETLSVPMPCGTGGLVCPSGTTCVQTPSSNSCVYPAKPPKKSLFSRVVGMYMPKPGKSLYAKSNPSPSAVVKVHAPAFPYGLAGHEVAYVANSMAVTQAHVNAAERIGTSAYLALYGPTLRAAGIQDIPSSSKRGEGWDPWINSWYRMSGIAAGLIACS